METDIQDNDEKIKKQLDLLIENNISMVSFDVKISCDTFWNYSFRISVRISDYYDASTYTSTNQHAIFKNFENFIIGYVVQKISEDFIRTNCQHELHILNKKKNQFHIHGPTFADILFPSGKLSYLPNTSLYICTCNK